MLADEHEPARQPSARAALHWRIVDGLGLTLTFALLGGIAAFRGGQLAVWLGISALVIGAIIGGAYVLLLGWYVGVLPWLGIRYYRYELTDDAIYLQRGLLTRSRTIIPYARVQSVKSTTGPVERRLGLTTLVLITAAQAHKIEMLDIELADELHERVCRLVCEAHDDL